MDALGSLDEIAEQTSVRVNERSRHGKFGWAISPSIERARAAREQKPKPIVTKTSALPQAAAPAANAEQLDTHAGTKVGDPITCYTELISGIRDRVGQLEVRYLDFDKLAGFAEGLTGKVFGEAQVKRLGVDKTFDALRAAGLCIRLEIDPEQTAKMRARIAENFLPRQACQVRLNNHANISNKMVDGVLSYLAATKGGLTKLNDAVRAARSNSARHAAEALWQRKRLAARAGNVALLMSSASALRPPDRETLDTCAEEEASAA